MKIHRFAVRGFTLVELLVSITILVIAIAAASTALKNQYGAMQSSDMSREANTANRNATTQLEGSLRIAGWGIDPKFAIDLHYGCAGPSACVRDRNDGPDDLVFVARNPLYRWQANGEGSCATASGCFTGKAFFVSAISAANPPLITACVPGGLVLEEGRVVEITCNYGTAPVLLTVGTTVTSPASTDGGCNTVTFAPNSTASAPYNSYTRADGGILSCHATGPAFLVDRYHYYVSDGGTPWLMLDTGLYPSTGGDVYPVAKNVEDMQVAYVLNTGTAGLGPDTDRDWVLGDDSSTASAEQPSDTVAGPDQTTADTSATRFTKHPANVQAIRVTLRLRSDRPDRMHGTAWQGDTLPYSENRAGRGQLDGGSYRRYTTQTEVNVRNLQSKSPFIF